jgi:hypothetical protein
VIAAAALIGAAAASAGWIERQVGEWRNMSSCTATPPGHLSRASVGHHWTWKLAWPPGSWTCVYRNRRGAVVATRPVR